MDVKTIIKWYTIESDSSSNQFQPYIILKRVRQNTESNWNARFCHENWTKTKLISGTAKVIQDHHSYLPSTHYSHV